MPRRFLPQWLAVELALLAFVLAFAPGRATAAAAESPGLDPGPPVDYRPLAFQPDVWTRKGTNTMLVPWSGTNVVFLTLPGEWDRVLMARWVQRLDQGWNLYADLTGARPQPLKQLGNRAVIAAVPDFDFTCGAGCGYLGASGIELAMFYRWNYPALKRNSNAMPHYVFYEMGRNFYTFADRHSAFTTGFAVFLRYVCMDALGCDDDDLATRRIIESVEPILRTNGVSFLRNFTNAGGLDEKAPRAKDATGAWIQPSDQPVTYAAAMLRLRRELGGDDWVRGFFRALASCPPSPPDTREGALRQGWHWFLAASVAARRDLSGIFVEQWRLPLAPATRAALARLPWSTANLAIPRILADLQPEWLPGDP